VDLIGFLEEALTEFLEQAGSPLSDFNELGEAKAVYIQRLFRLQLFLHNVCPKQLELLTETGVRRHLVSKLHTIDC
jgi:hypothetical protein